MRHILLLSLALACPLTSLAAEPIKVLIITGDHGHDWKSTTPFLKDLLTSAGMSCDATETPAKDLTADNLAKYDVLLLNYKDTKKGGPDTKWSDENKKAFKEAVAGGKGLLVYHHASSAFITGDEWDKEFERVIAGGWRKQGNHGKRHEFTVTMKNKEHPITAGMPDSFAHNNDELYQNSVMFDDCALLATAWSDKKLDPKNTDKHEPILWTSTFGKGRVCNNVLGHDVPAMDEPGFKTLLIRGVEWCATGEVKTPVPPQLKKAATSGK
jgi:type 1 glutamine amidotransferase